MFLVRDELVTVAHLVELESLDECSVIGVNRPFTSHNQLGVDEVEIAAAGPSDTSDSR